MPFLMNPSVLKKIENRVVKKSSNNTSPIEDVWSILEE